ncbi:Immediate early response 3-interacting protein 1 [Camellia lanceoleosa]|uniref:Immediate early response 3-interacting protein 1 n=1 Tax=Camellia lanceoleosa TaxID=1840588 RepID=A0ACC0H5D8_9ERIC|nr:Immediate early response 3-interacting protein 1 [Camellia lanceoleosa]
MMYRMGIWMLLEGWLLVANALEILNKERFLVLEGWSFQEFSSVQRNSLKGQLLGLIYVVQDMRIPIIVANTIVIVVELVSG